MSTTRLTRSQLYALVWSKATMHVAKELGLSGVGLAKLCRRHDIPVPERGYWARLQHGYKPKQMPLPAISGGRDPSIEIQATVQEHEVTSRGTPEAQLEARPERRIHVDDTPAEVHKSLRRTATELRRRKPDVTGRIDTRGEGFFSVHVAPQNVERTIRILQALCYGFDDRQYSIVKKEGEGDQSLQVSVNDEPLSFWLEERVRKVRHEPTAAELAQAKRESWFKIHKYDDEPTGALVLKIEGLPVYGSRGLCWADTKKVPLEERLNEFMAGLIDSAAARKIWRAEQERLRLEREDQQRKAAEKEARARLERARMRFFEEQASLWHRRERLRTFLVAVKERLASGEHSTQERAHAEEWIAWADAYLRSRDSAAIPFFNPLFKEDDRLFGHYAWRGGYNERDAWFDLWGS